MSFNAGKMANLILKECDSVEERCEGYKKKILDTIIEILRAEQEHKTQWTQIQQKVNEACHNAGDFLSKKRDIGNSTTEDIQ